MSPNERCLIAQGLREMAGEMRSKEDHDILLARAAELEKVDDEKLIERLRTLTAKSDIIDDLTEEAASRLQALSAEVARLTAER